MRADDCVRYCYVPEHQEGARGAPLQWGKLDHLPEDLLLLLKTSKSSQFSQEPSSDEWRMGLLERKPFEVEVHTF